MQTSRFPATDKKIITAKKKPSTEIEKNYENIIDFQIFFRVSISQCMKLLVVIRNKEKVRLVHLAILQNKTIVMASLFS